MVYFAQHGPELIILLAGNKSNQKAGIFVPRDDDL